MQRGQHHRGRAAQLRRLAKGMAAAVALLFAAAQASAQSAGEQAYASNCSACHGAALEGSGFGPPLNSVAFGDKWRRVGAAELTAYIRRTMPPARPGALSPEVYAAASDHVARANGIAAKSAAADAGVASTRPADRMPVIDPLAVGGRRADPVYEQALARRREIASRVTPVTDAMLKAPAPADWLTARGQNAHGYSPLAQIDRSNVARLAPAWTLALGAGTNAIAPVVHDGIMFLGVNGGVRALDATSGELLWAYAGETLATSSGVPISQTRGVALYQDRIYLPTLDGRMVALNARTGDKLWTHRIFGPEERLQVTAAPLVADGVVIQGVAGCSLNFRRGGCFIVGLDAASGQELWRFQTIAHPGQPGGDSWNGAPLSDRFGASVWTAGSYDPELGLVYFGVGQTYKVSVLMRPNARRGQSADALYTDSTVALAPRTGKLVWYFQHLPGDVWDSDWSFEQTLMAVGRERRPAVATIGKMGIIDVVDARTGRFLFSHDLGVQTLVSAIDPKTGRKTINPAAIFTDHPAIVCPGNGGARNWPATAHDPAAGVLFVPLTESCMEASLPPGGEEAVRTLRAPLNPDGKFGRVVAYDLQAKRPLWVVRERAPPVSALLATGGGLLFEGWRDGTFRAVNSATGESLWRTRLDDMPNGFPISYAAGGKQYVAIISGGGTPAEILQRNLTPEIPPPSGSRTLWVFRLPE